MRRLLLAATLAVASSAAAVPLGTAFTYQGELRDAGAAANGLYDFELCLFDTLAGSSALVCHPLLDDQPVEAGRFTLALDFGASAFAGEERFLELRVRPGAGTGVLTPLVPRQRVTATPYALQASTVRNDAVGTLQLAPLAVTNAKLASNAVDSLQLVDGAVTGPKLGDLQVTLGKLAADSVDTTKIKDGEVTAGDLAAGAVGLAQIDTSQVQARLSGACAVGEYFRGVSPAGALMCEPLPGVPRVTVVDDPPSRQVGTNLDVTIGTDGNPILAYREQSQGTLRVLHCGNSACTAGNTVTDVDTLGDAGFNTRIAIGSDGLPAIAHVIGPGDIRFVHCGNVECSSGNTLAFIENTANQLQAVSMAIGADGFPIFSYSDRSAPLSLKFARCTTVTCAAGSVTTLTLVDTADDVGVESLILAGTDGLPAIVYRNTTTSSLDYLHCGSVDCATGNTTTPAIDPAAGLELDLSATLVPALAGPMIVYRRNGAAGLIVLSCGGVLCDQNEITPVAEPLGHTMTEPDVALAAGNVPVISFHDATGSSMRVLRCSDRRCSGAAAFATLDSTFSLVGPSNALVVGADGLPVVAYQHGTAQSVRVAKCGSPSCN